ncbi:DUF2312 domain-containing protein [Magnetospirillum sulfuroxidans]|nr:GapR family DNA-binding domain-containing protein [Magnetospirillum sulfuroxidans]
MRGSEVHKDVCDTDSEGVESQVDMNTVRVNSVDGIQMVTGGLGFDVKILRKIISLRKMEDQEREEVDQLLELYKAALGMV